MKTPNYILMTEVRIEYGPQDTKIVPAGSFVRPVLFEYLPSHVKEAKQWLPFNKAKEIYVYCRWGFIKVQLEKIREAA